MILPLHCRRLVERPGYGPVAPAGPFQMDLDSLKAIVATLWFFRSGQAAPVFLIAEMIRTDPENLILKATGWMHPEAGKCDLPALKESIGILRLRTARAMFRYAIQRFPEYECKAYLRQ